MHLGFLSQFGPVICVGIFLGEYQRSQDCCNCSVSSEWIPSFSKGRKGWAAIVVYLWSGNS